jgi:hypothetical protein
VVEEDGFLKIRADTFGIKLRMGRTEEIDRHVNTPPKCLAFNGFLVNITQSFPLGEIFTDL